MKTTIRSLQRLRLKFKNKVWVLCHGVFDILHPGHIRHLEWAKQQGDVLIVSLTPDDQVQKGPGRPHFSLKYRVMVVDALQVVDYVVTSRNADAIEIIEKLKPTIYVKGPDIQREPTEAFKREAELVEKLGGKILFSPNDVEFHSTDILNGAKNEETKPKRLQITPSPGKGKSVAKGRKNRTHHRRSRTHQGVQHEVRVLLQPTPGESGTGMVQEDDRGDV